MSSEVRFILLKSEVIAINQDKAGIQGKRIESDDNHEVWIKNLYDSSKAIILFNKKDSSSEVTFNLRDINETGRYMVRDLWERHDKGIITDSYSSIAAPHGVVIIKISKEE